MADKLLPPYLKHAINDGLVRFSGEGKTERIHYVAADHSERWADPEEKCRAEFWAELIYKYEYRPERIRFEVKVPRRTPNDLADLVIYGDKDDELKAPSCFTRSTMCAAKPRRDFRVNRVETANWKVPATTLFGMILQKIISSASKSTKSWLASRR